MQISDAFRESVSQEVLAELNGISGTTFALDHDLRLAFMNDGWKRFALANDGESALEYWIPGLSIFDAIADVLHPFYRGLYREAFAGSVVSHEYDCHSDTTFRQFRMTIYPIANAQFLLVDNGLLVEKIMEGSADVTQRVFREQYTREADGSIVQCVHCRRIRNLTATEQWDFVPLVFKTPDLIVSHGLCRACMVHYYPDE